MKNCNYCGYKNPTRVKSPRKCPVCGNPYGAEPTRKLTGRYLKWGGLLLILALLVVAPVAALSLTFQDSSEFGAYIVSTGGTPSWTQSATGGNSYVSIPTGSGIRTADASQTTYIAFTILGRNNNPPTVTLLNSGGGTLAAIDLPATASASGRYEIEITGGRAYLYWQDILVSVSAPIAQNPSYVSFSAQYAVSGYQLDDLVYGASENRNIFGSPEQGYFIKKDMVNPAASGFCFPNGTIISNYNMTTTWGFGNSNASQTVILKEWSSGYTAATYATPAGSQAGSINWAIYDDIINDPTMPYGYYITTVAGSGTQSAVIPYVAYGATVNFDRSTYARGDTATIAWAVHSGGYWDAATYGYRIDVMDVYGNVIETTPVTMQSGGTTATFTTTDPLGVYYAVLIATPTAGGDDIWMNYDTAELTGYLVLTGVVHDGPTALPIPIANVSIGQDATWFNYTTSAGNYTTNVALYSGTITRINITAPGYRQYINSFTPLEAKTIELNFTLVPISPAITGLGIGGVVRDSVYGRPVPLTAISITNTTFSESYPNAANSVGYYEVDETDGAYLTVGRCYSIAGTKSGYTSQAYLTCVEAV